MKEAELEQLYRIGRLAVAAHVVAGLIWVFSCISLGFFLVVAVRDLVGEIAMRGAQSSPPLFSVSPRAIISEPSRNHQ